MPVEYSTSSAYAQTPTPTQQRRSTNARSTTGRHTNQQQNNQGGPLDRFRSSGYHESSAPSFGARPNQPGGQFARDEALSQAASHGYPRAHEPQQRQFVEGEDRGTWDWRGFAGAGATLAGNIHRATPEGLTTRFLGTVTGARGNDTLRPFIDMGERGWIPALERDLTYGDREVDSALDTLDQAAVDFGLGLGRFASGAGEAVLDGLGHLGIGGGAGGSGGGSGSASAEELARVQFGEVNPALQRELNMARHHRISALEALRERARELNRTGQEANQDARNVSLGYQSQAATAHRRDAPQMTEDGVLRHRQLSAVDRLKSFQPGGFEDVHRLREMDFSGGQTAAGLDGFMTTTAGTANRLSAFDPSRVAAETLSQLESSGEQSAQALDQFAQTFGGPSAQEAMLKLQSARDQAKALGLARSARGGAGAQAEAVKTALAENTATAATTRGQAAILRADEEQRRRTEAMDAATRAGQFRQAGDEQRLQATTAAGELLSRADAQELSALEATGQLRGQADDRRLQAQTAAGQFRAQEDERRLQAQTTAGQLDQQRSQQRLEAETNISRALEATRGMDVEVARQNLSAELQTLNMNDAQIRAFSGLAEQARQAGAQAQMDAQAKGIDAEQAAQTVQAAYVDQVWRMMTAEQRTQLDLLAAQKGWNLQERAEAREGRNSIIRMLGNALEAGIDLFA